MKCKAPCYTVKLVKKKKKRFSNCRGDYFDDSLDNLSDINLIENFWRSSNKNDMTVVHPIFLGSNVSSDILEKMD